MDFTSGAKESVKTEAQRQNCASIDEVKPPQENAKTRADKQKLSKSERRALQEAQRAAKLERISKGLPAKAKPAKNAPPNKEALLNKKDASQSTGSKTDNTVSSVQQKLNQLNISDHNPAIKRVHLNSGIADETKEPNPTKSTTPTDEQGLSEKAVRSRNHMDDPSFHKRMNKRLSKQNIPIRVETTRKMVIFSHLKQYDKPYIIEQNFNCLSASIGYDFIVLGLQYSDGILIGSNARSTALLMALRNFVINYKTPCDKVMSRDMEVSLRPPISFLNQCRPMSIGMGNVIKCLKFNISNLPYTLNEAESKELLLSELDLFYQSRIINAHNSIVNTIQAKIDDNEVILTYACSSLVSDILVEALNRKKNIKLIIVDSKPRFEGRKMLDKFSKIGIECVYTGINGISYVMKQVTKVLLGAHGLLANGAVISRVGSAMVTTVANAFNVPVLVCCESYKFSERAQTDAIVYNELCDPHELITSTPNAPYSFQNWKNAKSVCMLNLSYDVILPKFISALATELGVVPCTSAPIVIRIKNSYT